MKNLLLFIIVLCALACKNDQQKQSAAYIKVDGETMGTTYHVTYADSLNRNLKKEIDQLLIEINLDVSTYIDSSFISRFNQSEQEIPFLFIQKKEGLNKHFHFRKNYEKALEVFKASDGYFDPTVMPLVNYWGFGYTEKKPVKTVDSLRVDSLMQFVGFEKVVQRSDKSGWLFLGKTIPGVQLDFSAIAKGYGVDAVGWFLEKQNIHNYMVEIGGEVRARGKNDRGAWWTIGVSEPKEGADPGDFYTIANLENKSLATSGNYRNFYKVGGHTFAHTLNPKTGFPERNNLLSVSVFAEDCMTADAYATACMTMGLEKAFSMISQTKGTAAFFIYLDKNNKMATMQTEGLEKIFQLNN